MCRKQSVQPEMEYKGLSFFAFIVCWLLTAVYLSIYLFLAEITFCNEVSFHCSNIYRTKVHINYIVPAILHEFKQSGVSERYGLHET